ncbi:hypothetical protein [Pseudophaeobacter sp.]|uniref:hypothetical protein n=1 Tax=Pseudophaeobacter sp. TaxID=1971739 RepID=UPI00405A1C73
MPEQIPAKTSSGGGSAPSAAPYAFQRRARSLALCLALCGWLIALGLMWGLLGVMPWILLLFALPTGPAFWDIWRNPASGINLDTEKIQWFTGKHHAAVRFDEIAQLRLDRRWDFSFRVTLVLQNGSKIRLPQAALPPVQNLEEALNQRGIASQRHHFTAF